jgi:hypothetical protein
MTNVLTACKAFSKSNHSIIHVGDCENANIARRIITVLKDHIRSHEGLTAVFKQAAKLFEVSALFVNSLKTT